MGEVDNQQTKLLTEKFFLTMTRIVRAVGFSPSRQTLVVAE